MAFFNAYLPKTQLIKIDNSLDSSRPYESLLENPKTWDSRELFLSENDFKSCSTVNYRKWLKTRNLRFLEFCFYLKYISNKDDIWHEETVAVGLLEERKFFKIKKNFKNKDIHNGCAKMQNNIVKGCIKEFLIICKPKTKKIKFVKTVTTLGLYIVKKKMQELGFLRVTFVCKWFKILLHSEFLEKSLTLKACKPMKGMKIIW